MRINNAYVFSASGEFKTGNLCIEGERLTPSAGGEELDASGLYAIPGLIDIHLHGCMGREFYTSRAADIARMTEYQAREGITAVCPTTLTLSEDMLVRACAEIARSDSPQGAAIVGINLEGPFISPNKLGAQNPDYVHKPDANMFRRLQAASGNIVKLLDIAPEMEGSLELIQELHEEVGISLAHTTADYDTAMRAFAAGARHLTHIYNAMPPLAHREPGVIGAAFDNPQSRVEIIADNVHIHPAVVRATFKLFGEERMILISDSMTATGLDDGEYDFGGLTVQVRGNTARLAQGGNIAGSVTNLMNCLRTAVKAMNIPLATALRAATINPAQAIGIFAERGSLEPGKIADVVLLDQELNIREVILRGRKIPAKAG